MSAPDAAHPPAASGGGGMNVGKMWAVAILAIVVVNSGLISKFGTEMNVLFRIIATNAGVFIGLGILYLLTKK